MVRIWLVISLVISSCLFGEEKLEVASYYISKEHAKARFSWLVNGDYEEFDPKMKTLEMPRLERAPFQSRFFNEGDQLSEVTSFFEPMIVKWADGFQAVLNQTSGRVVIKGSEGQHQLMEYLFVNGVAPIKVHYHFDFYVFPPAKSLMNAWNAETLPDGGKKVRSFSVVEDPGRGFSKKDEAEEFAVEARSFASSSSAMIDLRWWFGGELTIDGEKVKIWGNRSEVALSGIARLHDLGSFRKSGKRLGLVKKVEVRHEDGTSMDDFIWWEEPRLPYHFQNVRDYYERFDYSYLEEGEGKDIRQWPVPPTFETFISPDDEVDPADADPFAIDDRIPPKRNPQIGIERKLGRGIDMKELLKKQGVEFDPEDFAFLLSGSGVLVVQADAEALELVGAITIAVGQGTPPNGRIFMALMEYEEEPDAATFPVAEGRLLAHGTVIGTPRRGFDLKSDSEAVKMDFEIEPNLEWSDQSIVGIRLKGGFQLRGEEEVGISADVSLKSGDPVMVTKFRHGKKWRAIVLRAEVRSVYEELPKEE